MNQNPRNEPPGVPFPPGTPNSGDGCPWIGLQSSNRWAPEDDRRVQIGDALRARKLWKVSVFGNEVQIDLAFGPNGKRTLRGLDVPLVVYVAGQVTVEAYPGTQLTGAPREAVCMIAEVDAAGCSTCRRFVGPSAVVPLSLDAAWFFALEPASLFIGGFGPYTVAAGERVPLRSGGTFLTSGSGFEEYET